MLPTDISDDVATTNGVALLGTYFYDATTHVGGHGKEASVGGFDGAEDVTILKGLTDVWLECLDSFIGGLHLPKNASRLLCNDGIGLLATLECDLLVGKSLRTLGLTCFFEIFLKTTLGQTATIVAILTLVHGQFK